MSAEPCNTCGGSRVWESTLEDAPTILVDLGPCPDCRPPTPIQLKSNDIYSADQVWQVIDDILDSIKLAEAGLDDDDPMSTFSTVLDTVTDYVTNQYGIDS